MRAGTLIQVLQTFEPDTDIVIGRDTGCCIFCKDIKTIKEERVDGTGEIANMSDCPLKIVISSEEF